jgi:hypothetical protein
MKEVTHPFHYDSDFYLCSHMAGPPGVCKNGPASSQSHHPKVQQSARRPALAAMHPAWLSAPKYQQQQQQQMREKETVRATPLPPPPMGGEEEGGRRTQRKGAASR